MAAPWHGLRPVLEGGPWEEGRQSQEQCFPWGTGSKLKAPVTSRVEAALGKTGGNGKHCVT